MTDDNTPTADLTDRELLSAILRRLEAIEAQGASSTKPLLNQLIKEMTETRDALGARMDGVEARLQSVEKQLRSIDRRFEVFSEDHMRMRADIRDFNERLSDLERRPN